MGAAKTELLRPIIPHNHNSLLSNLMVRGKNSNNMLMNIFPEWDEEITVSCAAENLVAKITYDLSEVETTGDGQVSNPHFSLKLNSDTQKLSLCSIM